VGIDLGVGVGLGAARGVCQKRRGEKE